MSRHTPSGPVTTFRRGSFWVGIEDRVEGPLGTVLRGPAYVEWEAPAPDRGGHRRGSMFGPSDEQLVAVLSQAGCDSSGYSWPSTACTATATA